MVFQPPGSLNTPLTTFSLHQGIPRIDARCFSISVK